MSTAQRAEVNNYGFAALLDMVLDAVEGRGLLRWLLDHTSPDDMTIRAGPGKELKITKEVVKAILGIPSSGGSIPSFEWKQRVQVAANFRASIGLGKDDLITIQDLRERVAAGGVDQQTMRCFFLIVMNRLLFPSSSWNITNMDIEMTEQMDRMAQIDWCQLVFNHLCDSVQKWHQQSPNAASRTVYGCCVVILVCSPSVIYSIMHIVTFRISCCFMTFVVITWIVHEFHIDVLPPAALFCIYNFTNLNADILP
jgi:hypothetical protein